MNKKKVRLKFTCSFLLLILMAILIVIFLNNTLYFTLIKYGILNNENTVDGYNLLKSNPLYISFCQEDHREAMIYDDKTISEIYSEITALEEYKESIDKNEIICVFQLLSLKGTVLIRQVEDGTIVVDNKRKQYVASQSLIDLLERLSNSKTRDYIILNED